MKKLLLFTFAGLLSACDRPGVDSTEDTAQQAHSSHIAGSVVVQSKARGNVIVLLFDVNHPPPPLGTGRPLSFTVIPKETVFANAVDGSVGPFTAPYSFSLVPPGSYILKGFVDANDDFIPWYICTGDVDSGDVGGAAVDPISFQPRIVTVDENTAADDVQVSFSDAARVPVDRPVFQASAGMKIGFPPGGMVQTVTLQVLPISQGVIDEPQPVFLVRFIDDNGDGAPDMKNGAPEMWPQVVVRKTDAMNPLLDENDLDKNGILDPMGVDYAHVLPNGTPVTADGQPDLVVLAAGIDPSSIAGQLVDSMGRVKQTPTPMLSLPIVVKKQALDASDPTKPALLPMVPDGTYAIYVIQETGQTWRVPNEMTPGVAEVLGLPSLGTQATVFATP